MASSFWGGFASTLLGDIQDNEQRKKEESSLEKRMRLAKELDAEYETTDVEDTDQAGKPIIRRINGKGKEVGRRYLTGSEVEKRTLAKRELLAKIEGDEASATVSKNKARDYDTDHQLQMDNIKGDNAARQQGLAIQRASLENQISTNKLANAREERIASAQLESNSAQTYANTKLDQAAEIISTAGRDRKDATTAMSHLKVAIARVVSGPGTEQSKKAKINSMISTFKALMPTLRPATAGSSGAELP